MAAATSMGELGRICCLVGLSFVGELPHRPRCIAVSAFLVIVSYLLLVIPDLSAPDSSWRGLMEEEVCRPGNASNFTDELSKCAKSDARYSWRVTAMTVFSISHFISGCASGIPLAYGIAVLNDHFVKKESAMYLGLHFISKVLGPVFGFLLGALSSGMLVNRPGKVINSLNFQSSWFKFKLPAWKSTIIRFLNYTFSTFHRHFDNQDKLALSPKGGGCCSWYLMVDLNWIYWLILYEKPKAATMILRPKKSLSRINQHTNTKTFPNFWGKIGSCNVARAHPYFVAEEAELCNFIWMSSREHFALWNISDLCLFLVDFNGSKLSPPLWPYR